MTTVVERIATTLAPYASEAFGLMGNGNAFFIDALQRLTDVRLTTVRHEAATVASADAYGRITRRLAIATVTYGAGFTNALTPLAEARMQRTPMIVVAGDAPTRGLRPWDVDQRAASAALGVPTVTIGVGSPGAQTLEAVRLALAERTPVILAIPYDLPVAETHEPAPALESVNPILPTADDRAVSQLAELLADARRPLVLAGRGAVSAGPELRALAEQLGALTVASAPARGVFTGLDSDLGVAGGFSSTTTLSYVRQADVVLVVGASLNQFTMAFGNLIADDARVAQIDLSSSATNPRVDLHVQADAQGAIRELRSRLATASRHTRWTGVDMTAVHDAHFDRPLGEEFAEDGRLDPRGLATKLNGMLPRRRHFASDGGHFLGWSTTHFEVPEAESLTLVGTAFQSIGLGFPSAPGAAIARPDSTLVVATGDGGGLMGISDLDSVVRAARSAVVIVYNDAAYNAEVQQYGAQGISTRPMLIDEVDFSLIARGVGAEASVIRSWSDLEDFERWLRGGAKGTYLLDCRISKSIVAPYQVEILEEVFGLDVEALGFREPVLG